jgi:hypothetical protein
MQKIMRHNAGQLTGVRGILPLPAALRVAHDLTEVVALLVLSPCAAL